MTSPQADANDLWPKSLSRAHVLSLPCLLFTIGFIESALLEAVGQRQRGKRSRNSEFRILHGLFYPRLFFFDAVIPFRLAFFFFSLALACSRARSLSRSLNSQLFLSLSLQKTQPPHHSDRDDLRLPTAFAKIVLKDRETPATRGSGADRTCQVREERAEKGGNLFSLSHFLRLRLRLCLLFFSLPLFLHSPSFSFLFPRLLLPQPPLRSKTAPTA